MDTLNTILHKIINNNNNPIIEKNENEKVLTIFLFNLHIDLYETHEMNFIDQNICIKIKINKDVKNIQLRYPFN